MRARWFSTVVMIASAAAPLGGRSLRAPVIGRIATVTDGDTFRLTSGERIRIADIDAPESQRGQAKCFLNGSVARPQPNGSGRCWRGERSALSGSAKAIKGPSPGSASTVGISAPG